MACLSDDGIHWLQQNEFVVREGGVAPTTTREYWHIGYPSVAQIAAGTIVVAYHEYSKDPRPVQGMWVTRFKLSA